MLELQGLRKTFDATEVIRGVDLTVEDGEFIVFVGPSGCGKSTLLRMIAGLERVTAGRVLIDGADVTRTDPSKRGIAMVFQTYALYPHMTVEQNMAFGLEMAGMKPAERREKVRQAADSLHLTEFLDRKPRQLSGGQRQRVAIGRAIVRNPKIFLFDEPLSNLDAELRVRMRLELAKLHTDLGTTMIYVTHDQVEAMTLASRIVVLNEGRVEQVGSPLELYNDPDNIFVAGFIGSPKMNLLDARLTGRDENGTVRLEIPQIGLSNIVVSPRDPASAVEGELIVGVRPEAFSRAGEDAIPVRLKCAVVEHLGGTSYVYSDIGREDAIVAELRTGEPVSPGQTVTMAVQPKDFYLFSKAGKRL